MEETEVVDLSSISSGVDYLKDGYIEYCEEVISNRALPSIYDGLKPVNRRILAQLFEDKVLPNKNYMKCARIVGNVLALHPHGDSSVYAAMVLMTDKNGSLAFPLVEGSGSFGGVYKTDPPAAMRYTEAKMSQMAYDEYFGEMNGIDMVPNFDATLEEPSLLPVTFPAVLVNSTSGIAVGFRSNIPSFNFIDVCNLVKEYIEKGKCSTVIAPDFVTGGYYIQNNKELQKLMQTGVARLKLRGKYTVNGKEINVTEVPYGKTIQSLLHQINDKNISAIRNAYDADDYEHGLMFTVDCAAKSRVDEAVYSMYKETDFQYYYNADITVIKNGSPMRLGVWNIIEEWVKWRREVLKREFTVRRDDVKYSMRESQAFMNVVNQREKCYELVNIATKQGTQHAKDYVKANFTREEVPEEFIGFVCSRPMNNYYNGGNYADKFQSLKTSLDEYEGYLSDIDAYISKQMDELIQKYGSKLQRRTEITTKDYMFEDKSAKQERIEDESKVYYALKDGFLRKCSYNISDNKAQYIFEGKANDTLIAFDNRGRLIRVFCSEIPITGTSDLGVYITRYANINETEDYRITWIGRLTGETLMLLYKDGNIGFVDTSEWDGNKRNVKVLENGISSMCAENLGAVLPTVPEAMIVTDNKGRISWCNFKDIKRKNRTAKTKVFTLGKNSFIDSYATYEMVKMPFTLKNLSYYDGRLKKLSDVSDFLGDVNDFIPTF